MSEKNIVFESIGLIYSPHTDQKQTPVQPVYANGIIGKIVIYDNFIDGLKDLDGFSHIYLFYYFHDTVKTELLVKPFLEDKVHGIFATRAPYRPNKLGMSVVRLKRISGNTIYITDVDILNETPLIDIKPYVTRFDHRENVRSGWQDDVQQKDANIRGLRNYKSQ